MMACLDPAANCTRSDPITPKCYTGDIGIAKATVKVHRSRVMRKMKARSLPELGRMPTSSNWCPRIRDAPERPHHSPSLCMTGLCTSASDRSGPSSL
jgi:hypothetical protein